MNKRRDQNNFTEQARRVLEIEARAVLDLIPRLDSSFAQACELCLACAGRVVVTGMGKSGHVGGKIATWAARLPPHWPVPGPRRFSFILAKQATAMSG